MRMRPWGPMGETHGTYAYAFSAYAIPPAVTALVVLSFAVRVALKHFSRTSMALLAMAIAASGWQAAFAMMYLAGEPRTAVFWARVGYGFVPFLAPAIYHFVAEILRVADSRKVVTRLGWLVAAQFGILTLTTDYLVTDVRRYWWGFYPIYRNTASVPYLVFFAGFLGAAVWEIARAYPASRDSERARIGVFAIALAIGLFGAIDYLAVYGFAVYPSGYAGLLGFVIIASYAVVKYGLRPITPSLAAKEILSTMRDLLFVSDRDGRIQFANSGAYALLGYRPGELVGRQLEELIIPNDHGDTTLRGRSIRDTEYVFRTKSGEPIELTLSHSPVIRQGEVTGAVLIGRDLRERKRYERETRRAVTLLQSTLDSTADGILVIGEGGKILSWNQRLAEMWRIPSELMDTSGGSDLIEHLAEQLIDPAEFLRNLSLQEHPEVETVHLLELRDGRRFEQYSIGRSVDSSPSRVWSFRDVTARRAAEDALRSSETRYRLLFEQNAAGVCLSTILGRIIDCNATFAEMLGYSPDELTNRNLGELFERRGASEEILRRLADSPTLRGVEVELRRRDGERVWALENLSVLGQDEHALVHMTAVDISDRKRAEEQIEFHAYHDVLTQLPNRRLLADRLELSMLAAKRGGRYVAVLFIDLDRFKNLNDTLGHSVGDALLRETAERLRAVVRKSDTVARFGGDEFTVMLPDLYQPEDAAQVAQKILETIVRPISIAGTTVELSASIGIAVFPTDGEDFDTLLRNADNAMYRAKESGRNTYQLCTEQMKLRAVNRLSLQARLRSAIRDRELFLVYQPQVSVPTGQLIGAEALLRWHDRVDGEIEPKIFIPIAEDTRLILPLGEWVLREACRQMREWRDQGLPPLRVAVNLSARQLQHRELPGLVRSAVADAGIEPSSLELEITETTAMSDVEMTIEVLRVLREIGVSLAVDDFGSGYSSLGYLQQLPIDAVKIDRRFIDGVARSSGDAAIVAAVVNVARTLDLRVIAEGVETKQQLDFLQHCNCDEAQGFYFSRAVDPQQFRRLMERTEADPAKTVFPWSARTHMLPDLPHARLPVARVTGLKPGGE